MDKLQQENLELVRKLAAQEEALGYSNRQLDQRSSECQALSRQLEAALSDVRQQVKIREEKLESKWCHQLWQLWQSIYCCILVVCFRLADC